MRGRAGYAYAKLMNIPECISSDVDSYASTALRIASDSDLRSRLKKKILENNYRIFENTEAAAEFASIFRQLAANHLKAQ
jgi:predicted O-linked N-acetylglucosamine transferase (SPINDLY family)